MGTTRIVAKALGEMCGAGAPEFRLQAPAYRPLPDTVTGNPLNQESCTNPMGQRDTQLTTTKPSHWPGIYYIIATEYYIILHNTPHAELDGSTFSKLVDGMSMSSYPYFALLQATKYAALLQRNMGISVYLLSVTGECP